MTCKLFSLSKKKSKEIQEKCQIQLQYEVKYNYLPCKINSGQYVEKENT